MLGILFKCMKKNNYKITIDLFSSQGSHIHQSVFTVSLVPIVINQGLPAASHALLIHTLIREPLRVNSVRQTNIQVRLSIFKAK